MSKPRVLCFLDNPLGRDTEIVLPVIYTLENHLNAEVKVKFLWDILYIKLWKPDVILLPNIKGHHMYLEIARFAVKQNLTLWALESEGNFKTDGSYNYWGYNKDKIIYQEWLTCWSQRTIDFLKKIIDPAQHKKIILTGGTGFDRYIFEKFDRREAFLSRWNLGQFRKVIGYGGWAFGRLYGAHLDQSFLHFSKWKEREAALKWVEEQRVFVRDILRSSVEQNPDILYIFKKHPKENFESDPIEGPNEMNELLGYPNVLYIKNEEPISDIINVCDLWTGFETTTALESWLVGKPTILINAETDFPRSSPYQGSVITDSAEKLQSLIETFYSEDHLSAFEEEDLKDFRSEVIKETIGFADGKNHLRMLYHHRNSFPEKFRNKRVALNLRHLRLYLLMHLGRYFYNRKLFLKLPKVKKTVYVFENRKMPGFTERKNRCFGFLESFYKEEGIHDDLNNYDWSKFTQ